MLKGGERREGRGGSVDEVAAPGWECWLREMVLGRTDVRRFRRKVLDCERH